MAAAGLILDRDGTVTEERGYVTNRRDLALLPGVETALARARNEGWILVLITNQSAVGRGLVSRDELDAMHDALRSRLGLSAVYDCPHLPDDGCGCRKPAPGMIVRAVDELGLDPTRTVLVGDNITDVRAAQNAGVRAVLVTTGHGAAHVDTARAAGIPVVRDLAAAVDLVLGPAGG